MWILLALLQDVQVTTGPETRTVDLRTGEFKRVPDSATHTPRLPRLNVFVTAVSVSSFDPYTGKLEWSYALQPGVDLQASVVSGTILIAGIDGTLRAVDPKTGMTLWSTQSYWRDVNLLPSRSK